MLNSVLGSLDSTGTFTNPLNSNVPLIMIASCLIVLFIASRTIKYPHTGPKMPLGPLSAFFNNISLAGFLGAMSFGHILGTLAVFATSGSH